VTDGVVFKCGYVNNKRCAKIIHFILIYVTDLFLCSFLFNELPYYKMCCCTVFVYAVSPVLKVDDRQYSVILYVRYDILVVMKIKITFLWDVIPCGLMYRYRCLMYRYRCFSSTHLYSFILSHP
jgi:hypothetical protein